MADRRQKKMTFRAPFAHASSVEHSRPLALACRSKHSSLCDLNIIAGSGLRG